jgi:uncharacterized protein YndB with AHSA1/START domain
MELQLLVLLFQLFQEAAVIRRQVILPVDQDRLWEALTDPDQAAGWFGGRIDWELREGAPLRFHQDDGAPGREGRVEAVRPGRYLRYRWWTEGSPESDESEVTYLIEPTEEGSRLTIQEREVHEVGGPALGGWSGSARSEQPGLRAEDSSASWTRWDDRVAGAWIELSAATCARASV